MPRRSKKERLAAHAASADRVRSNVRIRKSLCEKGGGGAFTSVFIKAGSLVGFYEGKSVRASDIPKLESRDYVMLGDRARRDAYDPLGRLVLANGAEANVHGWTDKAWLAMEHEGVAWRGQHASWTRFINHARGQYANLSHATTREKYGRAHALYAKRDIQVGEELFYDYGKDYWLARNIDPDNPRESLGMGGQTTPSAPSSVYTARAAHPRCSVP